MIVTKIERHQPEGELPYYTAHVHDGNGQHADVSSRYGSWFTADGRREVLPKVAAELQQRVRRAERRRGGRP